MTEPRTEIAVRPYDPADREALVEGFELAGSGAPGGEAWGHARSLADVYLTPYLDLEPESAFVVTADGRPAGYLVGCVDDAAFPSEDERTREAVRRHHLRLRPGPARFFLRARRDARRWDEVAGELSDPRWPSHLHVDVEPVARGTGAAARLMELWFDRLRAVGSPGCYLHTSAENTRGIAYFERMGFRRHGPNPPVPGLRFEGRPMHQQTMVWSAAED